MSQEKGVAPAVGASVAMNLGGVAQLTLQTFYPQEASDEEANAVIDRLMKAANRQKAVFDLIELADEIEIHERQIVNSKADLAKVDEMHKTQIDELNGCLIDLNTKKAKEHTSGYEAHIASGRAGPYEPRGITQTNMNRYQAEIDKIAEEKKAKEAQREVERSRLLVNIGRFEEELQKRRNKEAALKALVSGAANEG